VSVPRALPAAAVILLAGIVSVSLSFANYEEAYSWVAHTSDVRLVLGRAIGRVGDFGGSACRQLDGDLIQFAVLTQDNAAQQRRVPQLMSSQQAACEGQDRSALLRALTDADADERRLLTERRVRLGTMRQWTFVALLAAMLGAAALVLLAWRVQQRALADVRTLATQLEAISVTDELTQLYNRRGFLFVASPAFSLARRQGKPAAVLYADLDGLKAINDQLGHDHGDRALREFAQVMRSTFRTTDVLARLGGDEFAVFLYDITSEQIELVRHRLEAALARWNATPGVKLRLAASVGVALATETTASLDELVQTADTLMYDVKRSRVERRSQVA